MRTAHIQNSFKKDLKKYKHQSDKMAKLKNVMTLLIEEKHLPQKLKDHPLKGEYKNYRDCHVEPDLVLIYLIEGKNIYFERIGSHADIFG